MGVLFRKIEELIPNGTHLRLRYLLITDVLNPRFLIGNAVNLGIVIQRKGHE